jgi:hypothetical protein
MKKLILSLLMLLMATLLWAQYRVALHSNGNVTIFGGGNPFTEAYNAAVDGDTIYLPGGNLLFPGTIDKSLTIKGVGHYPVATTATNKTELSGNLTIGANADYLHIEGIHLTGTLNFATNAKVDFVTLKRNRFGNINYQGSGTTPCENNVISENIIDGTINAVNASYLFISNNLIEGVIANGTQLGVSNNIFLYSGSYLLQAVTNSNITNNIFLTNSTAVFYSGAAGNNLTKNIFKITPTIGPNTVLDNYTNVDMTTVFETVPVDQFDYDRNYSLLSAAQSTYLGNEGTQVGIYGGTFPFKTHSVPTNPTITAKIIAPQTNDDGELTVQITVEAQEN